jgi:pyridoxal phosphate enzyme (YggS family)
LGSAIITDIAANLTTVSNIIGEAEREAGRLAGSCALVAVSKTHPTAAIETAIAAGQRLFGENRIQESAAKWPALKAQYPDCRLHLIGPLQTNKVKEAVALFDMIETLDRPRLAAALAREMDRSGRRVPCLIEVNTGEEPQKAGVLPEAADAFIKSATEDHGLPILGLMCIPPAGEEPALHFALLREIAKRNGLAELSMGMSADYESAIRFGATLVRVGTAIFGTRQPAL